MKIAIIGTRGIPNHYGGFEQAAQYLSEGLAKKGHELTVYNSHKHPYKESSWHNVKIVHCYDAEHRLGTFGQFIYDLNCIRDAGKREFDVILFFGYTSSSIWHRYYPQKAVIIYNMDGLEWKRSKYSKPVQRFLRLAEKLAVKYSDHLIADSTGILDHLKERYNANSEYIPYGAEIINNFNEALPRKYGVSKKKYYLLIARMEPENNIETILDGFSSSNSSDQFLVVGNMSNSYGKRVTEKYRNDSRIKFTGTIFDQDILHSLRHFSRSYFHGHSVGGTNPSLLEAMADGAFITAHDNPFNKAVLGNDACYFSGSEEIKSIIERNDPADEIKIQNNLQKIKETYNWEKITKQYHDLITNCYRQQAK